MKKILIVILLTLSTAVFAEQYSMRNCSLLPITDTAGHALGYRVYERVEEYLKDSNWCKFKSTASLLAVFSKYRERLADHLGDPKVLRTVIDKLRVGSLFRINMKFLVNKVELSFDVLGENGIDLYFKEKKLIDNPNVESVANELIKWLELYEESIPYDGQVIGVLGDQLTFDIAGNKKKEIGQQFTIKRFTNKTRHKLLNTVVEWGFDELAQGKVFNKDTNQALGIIKVYNSNRKVKPGDWVKLDKISARAAINGKKYDEAKNEVLGRLGYVNININLGSSNVGTSPRSGAIKVSGLSYGFSVDAEAWITRKYFATAEFSRNLGSLSKKSGSPDLATPSFSNGVIKVAGGYKYLPMGFFYGPQVNLYGGYAHYSYNVEKNTIDGFGSNSISGILLGVGGSMPLQRGIRIEAKGEIIPFSSFNDDDDVFGSNKSSSSLHFRVGASYKYRPSITLLGGVEVTNNSAKFSGDVSEVTYRDTLLKLGARFVF